VRPLCNSRATCYFKKISNTDLLNDDWTFINKKTMKQWQKHKRYITIWLVKTCVPYFAQCHTEIHNYGYTKAYTNTITCTWNSKCLGAPHFSQQGTDVESCKILWSVTHKGSPPRSYRKTCIHITADVNMVLLVQSNIFKNYTVSVMKRINYTRSIP